MKRREFISQGSLASFGLAGLLSSSLSSCARGPFNVLTIIADQLRLDTLSCSGNSIIRTPNIDFLAQNGVMFRKAFTACPVCVPNRASMLTGNFPSSTGIINNRHQPNEHSILRGTEPYFSHQTIDEILTQRGYESYYFGKWHNPVEKAKVYQNSLPLDADHLREMHARYNRGRLPSFPNIKELAEYNGLPYVPDELDPRMCQPNYEADYAQSGKIPLSSEYSLSSMIGQQTVDCIKAERDLPFAITCSFLAPHPPFLLTEEYYDLYPATAFDAPVTLRDQHRLSPYAHSNNRKEIFSDAAKVRRMSSNYYGLIAEVDDWVGKILDALRSKDLLDRTLIVFTSDHGEMLGAHGMHGKSNFYEEAVRVPLIFYQPKLLPKNKSVEIPVVQTDIAPTIHDLITGEQMNCDGKSLLSKIGQRAGEDNFVTMQWNFGPFPTDCIRMGPWKLMIDHRNRDQSVDALYNLEEDPYETKNLLADKRKYANELRQLKEKLVDFNQSIQHKKLEDIKSHNPSLRHAQSIG